MEKVVFWDNGKMFHVVLIYIGVKHNEKSKAQCASGNNSAFIKDCATMVD